MGAAGGRIRPERSTGGNGLRHEPALEPVRTGRLQQWGRIPGQHGRPGAETPARTAELAGRNVAETNNRDFGGLSF
jgi:hypothetical protein